MVNIRYIVQRIQRKGNNKSLQRILYIIFSFIYFITLFLNKADLENNGQAIEIQKI